MTIVLRSKLCKILLRTARIGYENTYDMRGNLHYLCKSLFAKETQLLCKTFKVTCKILLPNNDLNNWPCCVPPANLNQTPKTPSCTPSTPFPNRGISWRLGRTWAKSRPATWRNRFPSLVSHRKRSSFSTAWSSWSQTTCQSQQCPQTQEEAKPDS